MDSSAAWPSHLVDGFFFNIVFVLQGLCFPVVPVGLDTIDVLELPNSLFVTLLSFIKLMFSWSAAFHPTACESRNWSKAHQPKQKEEEKKKE